MKKILLFPGAKPPAAPFLMQTTAIQEQAGRRIAVVWIRCRKRIKLTSLERCPDERLPQLISELHSLCGTRSGWWLEVSYPDGEVLLFEEIDFFKLNEVSRVINRTHLRLLRSRLANEINRS